MGSKKGSKRRLWDQENMDKALSACKEGSMSKTSAARTFQVPRKTLTDRLNQKVGSDHPTLGNETLLTSEDEAILCKHIDYMAARGFPLTIDQVIKSAWCIDKRNNNKFGPNGPSYAWWTGFKARHPESCKMRKPDTIDRGRATFSTVRMLRDYYQILKSTLDEHNFHDRPMDIYNCDETIVDLNKATRKVIVPKHYSKAHSRSVSGTEHISILCCANADGSAIPPMIIFKHCHPGGKYGDGGPDGALYSFSPSGFMDGDLFKRWLVKLFIPRTHPTPERPVLLILDGHASHSTIDVIEVAMANNVILLAMAPHTTHICQPLDVAVFRSFKAELGKMVEDCQLIKSDLWVTKSGVPRMLKAPFDNSMSRTNIKNGFRKCGIFPYDPNAIDKTQIKNVVGDVDLSIPHPAEEEVQETPSEEQDDAPALQVMDDLLDESSGDENHLHSNSNMTQVSRVTEWLLSI